MLWHDEGERPTPGAEPTTKFVSRDASSSGATGSKKPGSKPRQTKGGSVTTRIVVERCKDKDGTFAPLHKFTFTKDKKSIWYIEILRGQHTAITLRNAAGLDIRANNNENAVPMDSNVWIDKSKNEDPRHIFFYGHRAPQAKKKDGIPLDSEALKTLYKDWHCSVVAAHDSTGEPLLPAPLLVWVRPWSGNDYVAIKLYGKVWSLGSNDFSDAEQYGFKNHYILDKKEGHTIRTYLQSAVKAKAVHLVIMGHGEAKRDPKLPDEQGNSIAKLDIGVDGIDDVELDMWDALKGTTVKYIWFMACIVGQDYYLCGEIARRSGAWLSAPLILTKKPPELPPGHIEYFDGGWVYWNGAKLTTPLGERSKRNLPPPPPPAPPPP